MSIIATIGAWSVGTKIAVAAGASAVAVMAVSKTRPSTLLRVSEDAVIGAVKATGRRARRAKNATVDFIHDVQIEKAAREIDKQQERVARMQRKLRNLSPAQQAELAAQQAAIFARADQLRAEREGASDAEFADRQHADAHYSKPDFVVNAQAEAVRAPRGRKTVAA